jgi:zinc transport system substrate-binding protein
MNKLIKPLAIFAICTILLLSGCTEKVQDNSTEKKASDDKLVVAVSILPLGEFVEQVGGDNVRTVVMVPPGIDPHTYEPTPGQLKNLSNAQMYVKVGSGYSFETVSMEKFQSINSKMLVVNSSTGIKQIMIENDPDGDTGLDPHVWTSPLNAKMMVKNIYDGFVAVDPDNEATYKQNYDAYITKLDEADVKLKATLKGKEGSSFMVYHPAWAYLANDYGIHEIAVEMGGHEPSAKDMQNLIDEAKEKGIKVIFVQKGFSTASAQTIAEQIGGEVVEVDPLAKDYIDNLDRVSNAFAKGLA